MKHLRVYEGLPSNQDRITINIPDFTDNLPTSPKSGTIEYLAAEVKKFNEDYTWIASDTTVKNNLINKGFPKDTIIDASLYNQIMPDSPRLKLYLNNNHYFEIYKVLGANVYIKEDNNIVYNFIDCAISFPSYGTFPNANARVYKISGDGQTLSNIEINTSSTANKTFYTYADVFTDPYAIVGDSGIVGGEGVRTLTDDIVTFSGNNIPNNIGIRNYVIEYPNDLFTDLWSGFGSIGKLFTEPMQNIIALKLFPIIIPAYVEKHHINIGNWSTPTLTGRTIYQNHAEVDMGTIHINELYGSFLDYNPYTKVSIYLPFIGTKELDVDDVMGKDINLKYYIDLLTGSCNAIIQCDDRVKYTFSGICSMDIPVSSANYNGVYSGILSAALSIAGTAAAIESGGSLTGLAMLQGVQGVANAVGQSKVEYSNTGALTSNAGWYSSWQPYITITRPKAILSKGKNSIKGYPCGLVKCLNSLTGYTEVEDMHLENVYATSAEQDEIISLLRQGVIL